MLADSLVKASFPGPHRPPTSQVLLISVTKLDYRIV